MLREIRMPTAWAEPHSINVYLEIRELAKAGISSGISGENAFHSEMTGTVG